MKTMRILLCLALLSFLGLGCDRKTETGTVTDIDGNVYQTVKIGAQWWMAENLKTTKYRDGTPIPIVTASTTWAGLSTGAYCYYENDSDKAETYGALYNWYAVNGDGTKELAPEGWRVPTDEDWKELEVFLGMSSSDANNTGWRGTGEGLKLKSTNGWYFVENGTDEIGFAALPGGYRDFSYGAFSSMGSLASFWSASENLAASAWRRLLGYNLVAVYRGTNNKRLGFSVRCVKDSAPIDP